MIRRMGFTGYVADSETGLLHARARPYSTTLGRFVGRDPQKQKPKKGIDGLNYDTSPHPFDGYVDGMSLYSAYFAPYKLDPFGTQTLTRETECGTIKADLNPSAQNSNNGTFFATFTPNGKCCCLSYPAAQWISDDGGPWRADNPDNPNGAWYSYKSDGTFKDPNYHNGKWDDGKSGLGGDGAVADGPQRVYSQYAFWQTCFYCKKTDGTFQLLGCVNWYHYKDDDGRGHWGYGGADSPRRPGDGAPDVSDPNKRQGWPAK